MKVYFSVFKMRLINGLQYRTAALAGVATQFFWGFMLIMIYEAFYRDGSANQPMSLGQLVDYIWLQQSFMMFIALWLRDNELFNMITSGNIAYEMCRPCGIYGFWYAKLMAQRLAGALMRCAPILFIAFILPEPYKLNLPPDIPATVLFVITLILGLLVQVSVSMFIYISVFITMSPVGSILLIGVLGEFFAGVIIPIPLMPVWLQGVAHILPFRLAADLPFRVYSGNITIGQGLEGISLQLLWLCILVSLGKFIMSNVLRKVTAQGG